ncbi:hypothetical protein AWC11_02365 [Mycobacterium interjectum]|nr:hypothetical protein AWC11_02365 [Mycobacterium interjectum]
MKTEVDWSGLTYQTAAKLGRPTFKMTQAEMGGQAKRLAGGVGKHDSPPWTPVVKTPIVYPESKNRQAKCWHLTDYDSIEEVPSWEAEIIPPRPPLQGRKKDYHSDDPYCPGWYPGLRTDVGKRSRDEHQKRAKRQRFDDQGRVWLDGLAPGRTWDGKDRVRAAPGRQIDPDGRDDDDGEVQHRFRRVDPDHDGGRAPGGGPVTMRPGTWHVVTKKWSTAHTRCEVCGGGLVKAAAPADACEFGEPMAGCVCNGCLWDTLNDTKRKYCPGECTTEGNRRTRSRPGFLRRTIGGRRTSWYAQPGFPDCDPEPAGVIWKFSRWQFERAGSPPLYGDPTGETAVTRLLAVRLENPSATAWAIKRAA